MADRTTQLFGPDGHPVKRSGGSGGNVGISVLMNPTLGTVMIHFSEPVTDFALDLAAVEQFALSLIRAAHDARQVRAQAEKAAAQARARAGQGPAANGADAG